MTSGKGRWGDWGAGRKGLDEDGREGRVGVGGCERGKCGLFTENAVPAWLM